MASSSAPPMLLGPHLALRVGVGVGVTPRRAPAAAAAATSSSTRGHRYPTRVRLAAAAAARTAPSVVVPLPAAAAAAARARRRARAAGASLCTCGPIVDLDRPAREAVRDAAAYVLRPLVDNFNRLFSLKTAFDIEDYNIGMPTGALIACVGCYQLLKMNPSLFVDAVLGYAFYKLSVLSSQVRKQGFPNEYITRIKTIIALIFIAKDFHKNFVPLDYIK
uniref:Uncharacterized protein n=4 Tax=Oryza TaxID=4527 RepID=A0A0D3H8G2_9ORYZ